MATTGTPDEADATAERSPGEDGPARGLTFFRENPKVRVPVIVAGGALAIVFGLASYFAPLFLPVPEPEPFVTPRLVFGVVAGVAGYAALLALLSYASPSAPSLDAIERRKVLESEAISRKYSRKENADVIDTIRLGQAQLHEYYIINKSQARTSYRFAILTILAGFLTLLGGIWFFYFGRGNLQLAVLSGICGIILQFIGGTSFFLYRKAIVQLNHFYDQLVMMQHTMLSIKLAQDLPEGDLRDHIMGRLILSIMRRGAGDAAPLPDVTPERTVSLTPKGPGRSERRPQDATTPP
jgi:hypothetical protein